MEKTESRPTENWEHLLDDLSFLRPDFKWDLEMENEFPKRKVLRGAEDIRVDLQKFEMD